MANAITSRKSANQKPADPGVDAEKAKEARKKQREEAKAARKAERDAAKANKEKKSPFRAEGEPLIETLDGFVVPESKLPPKRADFKNEYDFFEFKARESDARAAKLRQLAEESKAGGSTAEKTKLKKLKTLSSNLSSLTAELEASGVDVAAFLASLAKSKETKNEDVEG